MHDDFFISSTYLRLLVRSENQLVLSQIEQMGIDTEVFFLQEYAAGKDVNRLFQFVAQQGVKSWLLSFSDQLNIASHGPLGFAVLSAPNIHRALEVLVKYDKTRTNAFACTMSHRHNRTKFIFDDRTQHELTGRWLLEIGMHAVLSMLETIMAHRLGDNARISFAMPEPCYANRLSAFYGITCEFNAKQTALSIPSAWCRISSPLYNEPSFRSNLAKCHEALLKLEDNKNLSNIIHAELNNFFEARIAQTSQLAQPPSLQQLAAQHFMSTRTLARKLTQHNTSYKDILSDVRKEHAQGLLKGTHLTILEIADKLAYQEQANFIRAFKNWFNMTPAVWRRQAHKESLHREPTSSIYVKPN